MRAITKTRKLAPEAVDFCATVMRSPDEPTPLRLKAAEIILSKAIPTTSGAQFNIDANGIGLLRVEFITGEQTPQQSSGKGNGHARIIDVPFEEQ